MATILPPPSKRQRTDAADRARNQQEEEQIPQDAGSLRVQFISEITGEPIGGPVLIPVASANPKNLESLINALQENGDDPLPYRFTLPVPEKKGSTNLVTTAFPTNVWKTLLEPGLISTEEVQHISAAPQAVFKVQSVSRCSATIPGHGMPILCCAFSPSSSSRMVSGSGDNTARIFDVDTGTPVHTLKGHTSWVLAVSWSPDGERIATGSMDTTIRLWDAKSGKQIGKAMTGHSKWVTSLAWEPYHVMEEGRPRIASSSKDATVRIYEANSQAISMVLSGHKGSVSCVRWGGKGLIYTASHDKTVKIWDATTGTLKHTLSSHAHWVNHLALSTDHILRTAFHDPTLPPPPTDFPTRQSLAKTRFLKASTISGHITERLLSASDDFTIYLWDPTSSSTTSTPTKPLARLHGHQKQVNHVSFSPDGLLIASCGFDNHTKLWNARTGAFIATLRGHVGPVYQAAWSADSRLLVTCSKDTTLKVWDVRGSGKLMVDLPGHLDEVYCVDWAMDGGAVCSGGKDKAVRTWKH